MFNKIIPIAAVIALGTGGAAFAQQTSPEVNVDVRELNRNVTRVDGTVDGTTVRGMTNPAQTRVRVQDPDLGRVDVRIKEGDVPAQAPDLSDVELEVRELNRNVTRVDATAGDVTARGMTNPAQTRVRARAEDGSRIDVRIKPPKQ